MPFILVQVGVVLVLAVMVSMLMRYLKQPLIIGYILTGLIISFGFGGWFDLGSLQAFSSFGVALLLFLVGLSLNPKVVKEVGPTALATGLGQIVFTSLFGYLLATLLGFSLVPALYLAIAFTFSSTVIIMSLLSQRRDENSLYGKISIGFLIVQDIVAMIILIGVSLVSRLGGEAALDSAVSLIIFHFTWIALLAFCLVVYVIPKIDKLFSRSSELLLLFALALAFGMAALFESLHFSMEMGALLAGVLLASSPYQREVASRVKPLRDFFLVVFFVALGFSMQPANILGNIGPAILFSLFILIGNPLIVVLIMRFFGYANKTGFMAGLTVAQISEFSLILLALGVAVGHLGGDILELGILVGLITIAGSSYMIMYADKIYAKIKEPMAKIIGGRMAGDINKKEMEAEVVLFGCHRLGGGIVSHLKKKKNKFLVVDFDPMVVRDLEKKRVPVVFGEADDWTFLETLSLNKAKLIIVTIPDLEVNLSLLRYLKKIKSRAAIVAVGNYSGEAEELYRVGATYVVVPPYLGRKYIENLVYSFGIDKKKYIKEQKRHLQELEFLG